MRTIRATCALLFLVALLALSGCGGGSSTGAEQTPAPPRAAETVAGGKLRLDEVRIESRAVGKELPVSVIEPLGKTPEKRPLLVFLHGAGGSSRSFLENEAVLDGLTRLGRKAPVVAFPEGEESWWHDRESGDWGRYVVREVIPAVSERFGTDLKRVAIGGISMGGYGAYHLGIAYPKRFCAIGGHSAGLWVDPDDEYPGAFDDEEDYEANEVIGAIKTDPNAFGRIRIWNDYGKRDWFVEGNAALLDALTKSTETSFIAFTPRGGHDVAYWDQHWPGYLRWYAKELAAC